MVRNLIPRVTKFIQAFLSPARDIPYQLRTCDVQDGVTHLAWQARKWDSINTRTEWPHNNISVGSYTDVTKGKVKTGEPYLRSPSKTILSARFIKYKSWFGRDGASSKTIWETHFLMYKHWLKWGLSTVCVLTIIIFITHRSHRFACHLRLGQSELRVNDYFDLSYQSIFMVEGLLCTLVSGIAQLPIKCLVWDIFTQCNMYNIRVCTNRIQL